ncbi:MAG: FAD-dependent oxidoreductase [Desulfobacterales bacterium]|nr:FAD-dependent oxidoreductase [Desulfobacterales bacterium]
MKDTSPEILILGGGVAGMSAALALSHRDVLVHLVEKTDSLGGNAASWACMATDTCQNCGACLSQEMADLIKKTETITTHLNTEITTLERNEKGMTAALSGGKTISAAKAIVATGFSPFDAAEIPAYHSDSQDKVITTAELNTLIREDKLSGMLGDAPKIAFLQCVGSRDRQAGRDYCSQVCCKISMRHAKKLRHQIPTADISLFYMDLQIMGKEARAAASDLAGEISLIQGVPAEILSHPETGRLTMVTEDPATLARKSMDFDLIVLSVGMVPPEKSRDTFDTLGMTPNTWGFFNTGAAIPGPDVIVAGCAKSPKDILGTRQEGQIAAATVLRELDLTADANTGIAVLGDGPDATAIAAAVAAQGYPAYLFGKGENLASGIKDLGDAKLLAVDGTVGNFSIFHDINGRKATLNCGAIISAPPPETLANKNSFKGAISLANYADMPAADRPDNAVILLDYFGPEYKAPARQALTAALAARDAGKTVTVVLNKMLVHGPTGQELYDNARQAGVRFLRYATPEDVAIASGDKGFSITMKETTLPGHELAVDADTLVVPDAIAASPMFSELSRLLNLGLDMEGFMQPANVRHRLVQSQRKGIFFAGACHDDIDADDLNLEIQAILAALETGNGSAGSGSSGSVSINEKKCAKCLTCYRVCPHGAIILNEKSRPQIEPSACFACQACVSNCPAYAIESDGLANAELADHAAKGRTLVLACERSAALAAENVRNMPDNTDLVSIPCACRISADMILKALINGADRVITSGCHDGNCRSGDGPAIAAESAAKVTGLPGITPDRVSWQPAAANEPAVFSRIVSTP